MEDQVSHISDLEGLNSELDGFLADLHGREETLAARVKTLEEELKGARASAGAELGRLAQKEAALSSVMEGLRSTLARESSAAVSLASERDELLRRLDVASRQLAEAKSVLAAKESALQETREAMKAREAELSAAVKEARASAKEEAAKLSAAAEEARASAKEEAARLSAAAEEIRAALAKESAKFSAAVLDRDDFARRVEASNEILNEARAALAEKDALLKETRTAAREKAAELAAALDKANSALHDEAAKVSGLLSERDVLLRRLEALAAGLEEEKNGSAKKEAQFKEASTAAKDKAAELTAGLEQVRAALREESAKAAELASVRDALLRQLADSADLLQEERDLSAKKDETLREARAAAKDKAAELSAALDQARSAITSETAKAAGLSSERDGLLRQLEAAGKLLDGEKTRSAEKENLVNSGRTALKAKDEEIDKILRGVEELRADLSLERANVKDREIQLQKAARMREGLEKKLELAAQENSRSEEGYLLKVELVKKELREQSKRAEELERKLAAAGARLDDALEEAAKKEKLLSELSAALTAKDAQLKEAGAKLSALAADYAKLKDGSGHENAERARQLAASMAARVEELENTLAQAAERHLEKYRSVQAELSGARADIRSREEENASLRAREDTISKELGDAEEKWKFASAQLHNSASKLRNSENELEILSGRLRSLEEERDKFRAAAIKAETAAAGMAARESKARDGEAAGLMAALEEQAAKFTDLLRKYDDVALLNETLAREKAGLKAEADSLREALTAVQASADAEAGEKRGIHSSLAERLRAAEAQLKKKDFELEHARAAASAAELEAEELRATLDEAETSAAGEAVAEKARYAALSERVHNADALLKKKEFELEEARGSLSGLEQECSLLRSSRASLGEKFAREIQAENELLKEAQAKILERDSVISRLSTAEEAIKGEAEALKRERQGLLALVRKKAAGGAHSAKVSEAERLLKEKESRLEKLRAELENTRAEKAELQGREKELREELKSRPYRAMLRESEEKLLIKEKMLADLGARMKRIGHDFEELKARGQSAGAPGYLPEFEELVAGVAHQVANSISIIRSHAEFCSEAPDSEGARESLDVIVRNIVNLQKKIDIIMNFSRPVIPQRSPERLTAVVAEVLQGLRASGKLEKIVVSVNGGEKLKPVGLDRVRFASAVEQLLLNAAEALPSGGELSLSVSAAGGRQRIEICDTGAGIEKKNLASVFHPFFTTKPGKMGLGLTLARNVARAHGGALELFSEPGKGTRAVLELPEN